ncbi:hypothetical protein Ancab_008189 [Ancistrocladus abbreviatus]
MSGGFRVSTIPSNVKKMIQNIKEITGNHSEEEIYAMLKECSMDPNETAQKLLLQDTFHEVKRKRDRKKENLNNREAADSRWRVAPIGRAGRGSRGNFSSRYSADAGGGRNSASDKENGINQASVKVGPMLSSSVALETIPIASSAMDNGPVGIVSGATDDPHSFQASDGSVAVQLDLSAQQQAPLGAAKNSSVAVVATDAWEQSVPTSHNNLASVTSGSLSVVYSSASDPVLVPSADSHPGATKRELGSQRTPVEQNFNLSTESKSRAEVPEFQSFSAQGKLGVKYQGAGKNQLSEYSQSSSLSSHGGSSLSRPSSNYGSRSQQAVGLQKVGPSKEWKPKAVNPSTVQGTPTPAASEEIPVSNEAASHSQPVQSVSNSEEATTKLQRELEDLHIRDAQHVIIPNHIHVPEAVRTGLSFGSFDANFVISSAYVRDLESEKFSKSISETPQVAEEAAVEKAKSDQSDLAPYEEGDYVDYSQSPTHVPENVSSGDVDASARSIPEMHDSKEKTDGPQSSTVHTSATYSFGLVPPPLGNPLAQFESSESQAHDISRMPGLVVQQPVDSTSLYAQFYRSGADTDGRMSPFTAAGVPTKYSGNIAVLATQTLQSPQEGGNSLVLSTSGQTPLATQAAGAMQSSIAVSQQAVPIFRQPAGVHIPHYPPNYIPYGHYISPFYVPPPAIHQFIGNNAFPQQGQAGSVYPGPPTAAVTGVKYPLPQYKPGGNTGNSMHIGVSGSYGPYGSSPAGYNPGSGATAGNSTASEDLAASQFKESNMYITGQQSEGSAVWIAAPSRDITGLQASSFYNLPPQGQPVTFTPTQAGHGGFAGIYHPAQAVTAAMVHPLLQQSQAMAGAIDMVGATAGVYQQPQHAQMNWPNNY